MGADVVQVRRPGDASAIAADPNDAQPSLSRARPEKHRCGRSRAATGRPRRRPHRRLPTGGRRAPGSRPGDLLRAQSTARVRSNHGLGSTRTTGCTCRPRHQLPGAERPAAPDRAAGRQTRSAAQRDRRLWRWRTPARIRDPVRAAGAAYVGSRTSDRRCDDRRRGLVPRDLAGAARPGRVAGCAWRELPVRCRALLRYLCDSRRSLGRNRRHRAAIPRLAAFQARTGSSRVRRRRRLCGSLVPGSVENVWPELKARLAAAIARHTRDELQALFEGMDACVTPVLSLEEAMCHPHNVARKVFIDVDGSPQNAPAPRFSRTPPATPRATQHGREATAAVLAEAGYGSAEIDELRRDGVVA